MKLKLYNTLTREKENFESIEKNNVKMYSCGPTVYNYAHIGNFRTYIFTDILKRVLQYNGYNVKQIINITDVGHLTSDADTGEDKMEKAAKKEGKNPYEIAEFYTEKFLEDFDSLNLIRPYLFTKATDNIKEMLEMVERIVKNGYGYETSKGIYFDVSKLKNYPVLSNNKVEEQEAGARIEIDKEKKNAYDFAIWIKAPENHIMKWDSPWGKSYPGWHIECSAMGKKFLGEKFDIHTGGVDHIPIHHENEIAQYKGDIGYNPVNYWLHGEFLLIDNGKMSKSLNNVYTIKELKEKFNVEPLAFKLFCYSSHYRNKLNFTNDGIKSTQVSLNRLRELYIKHSKGNEKIESKKIEEYRIDFKKAINDDLNISLAMATVWNIAKSNIKSLDYANLLLEFDEVLGLDLKNAERYLEKKEELSIEIEKLIKERDEAKKNKEWNKADEIREIIKSKGYEVNDTKEGTKVSKI